MLTTNDNLQLMTTRCEDAPRSAAEDARSEHAGGSTPVLSRSDLTFVLVLLLTIGAWFSSFPLLDSIEPVDVAFDLAVFAASWLGLIYVKRLRIRAIETGWKFLIWGHLLCLLDCFTQEQGVSPIAVSTAIFASESATITAVLWGLHVYINDRRRALRALRCVMTHWQRSESRYGKLVNSIDGIIWEADPETFEFLFVSRKAESMLGYPLSRWLEEPTFWRDHVAPEDREWVTLFRLDETRRRLPHELEYRMVAADGRIIWVREIVNFIEGPDGEMRLCGVIIEIEAAMEVERALRSKALRDDLTGLSSRPAFLEALQELDEHEDAHSVMFLDLDRFKLINDTLGHSVGDKVLNQVAVRIARAVNGLGDVARIGGDEFAVLLTQFHDEQELWKLASSIHQEMEAPILVDRHRLTLSLSIGIATGAGSDCRSEAVLSNADIAMYRAKRSSLGSTSVFDSEMRLAMASAMELENQLLTALDRQEFEVHYQPVVDLEEGVIVAFEALVRWRHPERGLLTAGQFLPQAEERKLSAMIGWWVVRNAFTQSEIWARTLSTAPLVSVNISKSEFSQSNLLSEMRRIISETGADPTKLILEITEDVVSCDDADQKLDELHRMGFILALDDFGVGCSSLSRLLNMPVQIIKLDRRFVPTDWDRREEALFRTVLAIGRDLSMSVIAEGIETEDQHRRLRCLGCRTGQGYLFSPAVPAEAAAAMLASYEEGAVGWALNLAGASTLTLPI
ncbi:MAG: EAL domain-containing protein [Bryobacterales bacterium]